MGTTAVARNENPAMNIDRSTRGSVKGSVTGELTHNMTSLLNVSLQSEADILELVGKGIAKADYTRISKRLELPKDAIGAETTIRNRLKTAKRLNLEESERLVMILRVYSAALALFGSNEKALAWLHKPARYLRDHEPVAPIELAKREAGVRLLEEKLLRTAHGVF